MAFAKFKPRDREFVAQAGGQSPDAATPSLRVSRATTPSWNLDPSDVLERIDIVDLISEVVELSPRGAEWVGLCPFHQDSHPSFEVNGAKGIYSCWSCSAGMNGSRGGDAITFTRRYYGMGFKEALEHLAQRAGMRPASPGAPMPAPAPVHVPRPATPQSGREVNREVNPEPLYQAVDRAQNFYTQQLQKSPAVIEYLTQKRSINPELLGVYRIGYAPDSFGELQKAFEDYSTNQALVDAGLVKESDSGHRYDFFRDRLMFAVRDDKGRTVGFGGRRVSDAPKSDSKGKPIRIAKYLNSPETAIFNKGQILFGWYEAQKAIEKAGHVLMVEGYMDVLGLANHGVMNAVACMGTALTSDQVKTIFARTPRIVFCFDGDLAGQEAAFRSLGPLLPLLEGGREVQFLTLSGSLDPDEFIKQHGKRVFDKEVERADGLVQFWGQSLQAQALAKKTPVERLWKEAQDLLALLPAGSPYVAPLYRVAARALGKPVKEGVGAAYSPRPDRAARPRARATGLASFVANEPSDRLRLAVLKVPQVAAAIRPQLIALQQSVGPDLLGVAAQWQSQFDQAMAAGMSTPEPAQDVLSAVERRQYEAVINAAPSILSQYLEVKRREMAEKALKDGEMDEREFLGKMRHSRFERPR